MKNTSREREARALIKPGLPRSTASLATSLGALATGALVHPFKSFESWKRASLGLVDVTLGRSEIEPAPGDKRFADSAWRDSPVFHRLMQAHLLLARESERLAGEIGLSERDEARAKIAIGSAFDSLAPTNTLLGNPAALMRTLQTGGRNLVDGASHLLSDLRHNGGLPSSVDDSKFGVGENLAMTPGAVVYREELLELIQYAPQTPQVHGTPLFIVPPQINKYYIWDLAPERSLVEHLVQQGFTVFVVSWFNPGVEQAEWGLDTYVMALERAMGVARDISRSPQLHVLGACSGGITATALLAYLSSKGKDWARSLTLLVAILDIEGISESQLGLFTQLEILDTARKVSGARGVLDGKDLAKVFAFLRPNELIWNYWVNNYLLGHKPPAFDILYWNSDTTALPARLHADFIALLESNALAQPGGMVIDGLPLDLRAVTCDSYILGGTTDHITPWQGCYQTRKLLGGKSEFVLSSSGHVQSIVNPPGGRKSSFRASTEGHDTPEAFIEQSQQHAGSWWPHLSAWLAERSDAAKRAPRQAGNRAHPPVCDAPGSYVMRGQQAKSA